MYNKGYNKTIVLPQADKHSELDKNNFLLIRLRDFFVIIVVYGVTLVIMFFMSQITRVNYLCCIANKLQYSFTNNIILVKAMYLHTRTLKLV